MCTSRTIPGEFPPPPLPCFGRDELIKEIVSLAENLRPIALIGAGGIGKTSIALALLDDDHIREQFGENRRFIRCDRFLPTLSHFLHQLSKVIGASIENPEDLATLRPFLSSKKMILVLDNAESILDPQGVNSQEIYPVVEELSRYKNICLCITSRLRNVPPHCKKPTIPTLSEETACAIFYSIYDNGHQSDVIRNLLKQLDYHALSITLLATTASNNMWDHDHLANEWGVHHIHVLEGDYNQTDHNKSLAATIELSLTSPTFQTLGPSARDFLSAMAFFPQGVDKNNLKWLFPTISNAQNIINKFCALSLTYPSGQFITMLAPLRDYLCPKDPESSPLLCATKACYFSQLPAGIFPGSPNFVETKWIITEDVNVEHLLNVFTSTDPNSGDIWEASASFMEHLFWHKPRLVMLGPKFRDLPDGHASKPKCLYQLSRLFHSVGNYLEEKELLIHTLELWRRQRDDLWAAKTLRLLSRANYLLGHSVEAIQLVKESLALFEQLQHTQGQADSLQNLAELLRDDNQLDAAEEAISKSINLLLGSGEQFGVCKGYRILGKICHSKGETEKAIGYFETALGVVSSHWQTEQFWIFYNMAQLYFDQGRFDDAHIHIERAKSHIVNDPFCLGSAMKLQAYHWYKEGRLVEARSEVLCASDVFEKLGAAKAVEGCRQLLQWIEEDLNKPIASTEPDPNGEPLETVLLPIHI